MKKVVIGVALLLFFAPLVLAAENSSNVNPNKYQIISERKGLFGLGGKTTMMLDRESGDSWVLEEGKWVAVPRVENEKAAEEDSKAQLAEQIKSLQDKYEQEINSLKAKQAEELKSLVTKQSAPAKVETGTRPATNHWKRFGTAKKVVKPERTTAADTSNQGEEGPPAWLNE